MPPAEERAPVQAPTGFLRMQRLMEKIRQRRVEPAAPLPQARTRRDEAPSACDADQLPSTGDAPR